MTAVFHDGRSTTSPKAVDKSDRASWRELEKWLHCAPFRSVRAFAHARGVLVYPQA